ncbi:MAG: DMT family transporter [Rhodospirillales bacterium]|nr:DMT family transporter [Rhodospirillales bacterium]
MAYMVGSTVWFAIMMAMIRDLSAAIHPFEITFFRFLFGLAFLSPVFIRRGLEPLRSRRPGLQILRSFLNVGMTLTLFLGLSLTPLAKVSALGFSAPLFASLLAFVMLREPLRLRRVAALVFGFSGALVILRPGVVAIDPGAMLVLFSTVLLAMMMISVKVLSRTDSSLTTVLYSAIVVTPVAFVAALFVWRAPTLDELALLAVMGVLGTLGQFFMAQAFKEADVTAVLPINFLSLIWASIIGYLAFAEVPDIWTWAGGIMIFIGATAVALRETRSEQR